MDNCGECKYFTVMEEGDYDGKCHRYAPRPITVLIKDGERFTVEGINAYWPDVTAEDGCGEFSRAGLVASRECE